MFDQAKVFFLQTLPEFVNQHPLIYPPNLKYEKHVRSVKPVIFLS